MNTRYRADTKRNEITRVECTRENYLSLHILQAGMVSRVVRRGKTMSYFETWEEAHNWLLDATQKEIERAKWDLQIATRKQERVKELECM